MTLSDIDSMGQKTITGKVAISKEDYSQLTSLAKEGITSRNEIHNLKEKCQPFLDAMEHFPDVVRVFVSKVRELFSVKEAQERREKEEAERRRQAEREARKQKNRSKGWER